LNQALNDLRANAGQVYDVQDIKLRRGPISITLSGGKLAFFSPLQDRVTGAVFIGSGHVIATPRDPAERLSMARFLEVPLLDQSFLPRAIPVHRRHRGTTSKEPARIRSRRRLRPFVRARLGPNHQQCESVAIETDPGGMAIDGYAALFLRGSI
jgi:hypothetical protein